MTSENMTKRSQKQSLIVRICLDDEGNPSSMRLMAIISFIASVYFALVEVYNEVQEEASNGSNTELVLYFLLAAFMPKFLQKIAEKSNQGNDNDNFAHNEKGWFTDSNGSPSSMRYMSLGALIAAIVLAVVEIHGWGSSEEKNELILYFLVAAFVPKALQKFAEKTM